MASILTGKGIRNDKGGAGYYGASRTKISGGQVIRYKHKGTDYECEPGQDIYAPCTGKIIRVARPYIGTNYSGILLDAKKARMKIFYIEPDKNLIGKSVRMGEVIGKAQDISARYKQYGVTPHVHLEIIMCDPEIFMKTGG